MAFTVRNKTAFITGAGAGIGRGAAFLLAKERAKVVATDIDMTGLEETASLVRQAGTEILILKHDVTPGEQWTAAYAWTKERLSGIDVIANVAGIHIVAPVNEISSRHGAAWRRSKSEVSIRARSISCPIRPSAAVDQ